MSAGSSTFTWSPNLTLHSTKSPFDSPLPSTHSGFKDTQPVSWKRLNIAGILLTVYGLEELPSNPQNVTCLWLLHGRGDTQDSMSFIAASMIHAWNAQKPSTHSKNLICISFDQRNHGSRMIDNLANESWNAGNPTHAQDMYSLFSGTAQDVSQLISHLPSYLPFRPTEHICGGVSLGAHATWHCILHDSRITAALIIIGCADYTRLMTDRAIRSKLPSCIATSPPGRDFLGSKDFPPSLLSEIRHRDPAGVLLSELTNPSNHTQPPSEDEKTTLRPIMQSKLAGKKLLVLSGGKDRLVPYQQSEPFLSWLKRAVDRETGWFGQCGTEVEDFVDPEARHEFSGVMRGEAERWLVGVLEGEGGRRGSKI